MPHKPEHKPLVDALIDGQLEAKELVDAVVKEGAKGAADTIKHGIRKLNELVQAKKLTPEQAIKLSYELWDAAMLAEFSRHVHQVTDIVDRQHERKMKAIRKLQGRVRDVAPIRKDDMLRRELERQGLLDAQGKLKGDDGDES